MNFEHDRSKDSSFDPFVSDSDSIMMSSSFNVEVSSVADSDEAGDFEIDPDESLEIVMDSYDCNDNFEEFISDMVEKSLEFPINGISQDTKLIDAAAESIDKTFDVIEEKLLILRNELVSKGYELNDFKKFAVNKVQEQSKRVLDNVTQMEEEVLADLPSSSIEIVVGARCSVAVDGIERPGVVIEPAKFLNKNRYLILFDDSSTRYVEKPCLKNVKIVKDVCNLTPRHKDFLQEYLDNYPETKLLKLPVGANVKVERDGKWWYAKVAQIDCNLILVKFTNGGQDEWIFRGSHRLGPMAVTNNNDNEALNHNSEEKKSVARKTTKRKADVLKEKSDPTSEKFSSEGEIVQVNVQPLSKKFVSHQCGPDCVTSSADKFVDGNLKGVHSIFMIPFQCGWSRQVVKHSNCGQRKVCYIAPCGRRLRKIDEVHKYIGITGLKMEIDWFSFDWWLHPLDQFKAEKIIVKDLSYGAENIPVSCSNMVDDEFIEHINYSTKRLPQSLVHINTDPEFMTSCDCKDDCSDFSKCNCHQLTVSATKGRKDNKISHNVGYEFRRLKEYLSTGIYECNSRCACSKRCLNRVVQQPLRCNLQVFKTPDRGWGLRTLHDVPAGTFLCVYVGNLYNGVEGNTVGKNFGDEYFADLDMIEVVEASKRLSIESDDSDEGINLNESSDNDDVTFKAPGEFMAIKKHSQRKSQRRKTAKKPQPSKVKVKHAEFESTRKLFGPHEEPYIMDAKQTGNIGRYLNHSCHPNVFVQNVFVDTHDLRFPWIAFFTSTYVKAGKELCWDYGYTVGSVPDKEILCSCGSEFCRGRLL